jgi:ring-1,2-phenylacetyl-CoA epoxidase subunit PaaE
MLKFFRKKTKKSHPVSDRYFQLKIKEVRKETDDASTLIFDLPDRPFHYKPGQFLTLLLPIEKDEIRRSYSLCSSPFTNENPAITVKRVESGKVSNYLNDHMKPGDTFDVMEPAGHFVVDVQEEVARKYVLFAAGSGITPIMSIIKSILAVEPKSSCILIYQNRNEHSIIFKEELDQLKSRFTDRLNLVHILSQPSAAWSGYKGRLDPATAGDILMDISGNKINQFQYYLCGPAGFMQTLIDTLMEFDVPEHDIHKESFYTGEPKPKAAETVAKASEEIEVKIILDGETHLVAVPPNRTILEAALDQDIDMPFSCQSGLCTACRGKLLHGHVEMEEEDGLSEEELNEGYILNCVGRPTGPGVEIEIG